MRTDPFNADTEPAESVPNAASPDDCSSSESSSDSSSSGSDGGLELDEAFASEVLYSSARKAAGSGEVLFQHKSFGTLHLRKNVDQAEIEPEDAIQKASHLACGRIISKMYNKVSNDLRWDWPKCKICFGVRK